MISIGFNQTLIAWQIVNFVQIVKYVICLKLMCIKILKLIDVIFTVKTNILLAFYASRYAPFLLFCY